MKADEMVNCILYEGLPTLTQAQANQLSTNWITKRFSDLKEAVQAAWRLEQLVPRGNIAWIIICDDGKRFERNEIKDLYNKYGLFA